MTIREIAEKLGVSPAAVSLVLNNKPGVGEKRRQLIQNALRENGYQLRFPEKKYFLSRFVLLNAVLLIRMMSFPFLYWTPLRNMRTVPAIPYHW